MNPFERESEFAMASPGLDQGALLLKRQLMGKQKPKDGLFPGIKDTTGGSPMMDLTKRSYMYVLLYFLRP